ncbi:MAG: hypothetical protein NT123_16720 [Proteobacteria bacterium]|nr:hypothetical protein [Pseudomonadota bacterium]
MLNRRSDRALILLLALLGAFALAFADATLQRVARAPALAERQSLVRQLGLTDLCLFTEARYTRHPSQADLHSAFQDHPFALEHFPTGSILPPPAALMRYLDASHDRPERSPAPATPGPRDKP